MTRLVCVGDLMLDVVARLPGPLAPGSDTPARVEFFGGGAAANVVAWAVVAGASASFVGRVGDDGFGQRAVAQLQRAGVDVHVSVNPDSPTGTCIVLVDPTGERTMVPDAGADDSPAAYDLPAEADWLYLSGYALLGAGSRPAAIEALATARERRWRIAVDAASAAPLQAVGADTFLAWVGTDVLLFANADEALILTGLGDAATAAQALAQRCGQAVVKRGADGAVWSDGNRVHAVAASKVCLVDSTGAGDAFAAGFLATPGGVPDRLASAARLAASAVSRLGGRP